MVYYRNFLQYTDSQIAQQMLESYMYFLYYDAMHCVTESNLRKNALCALYNSTIYSVMTEQEY